MRDSVILTGGDRKLLSIAGGLSAVLIAVGIFLSGRVTDTVEMPTTYSAGSAGAKAAYLLLAASGYRVQRWERPLEELPAGDSTTLIVAEPENAASAGTRVALERFVEQGGTVIVTGGSGGFFVAGEGNNFDFRHAIPDLIAGLTWERIASASPSAITRAAPEITLAPQAYWYEDRRATTLYGTQEKPRVIKYERGNGRLIWWASATPLTNAGLREPGNLEFFLACIGDRGRLVLWDEYSHRHSRSDVRSRRGSRFMWIGGQAAAMVAALLLTYSRRSGPIVVSKAENRLSPLEFVRTLGAVYRRAGAASVAVDIGYERFRYQLTHQLGIASTSSNEHIERAAMRRWNLEDRALGDLLRSCEAAREDADLSANTAMALTRSLADWSARLGLSPRHAKENG